MPKRSHWLRDTQTAGHRRACRHRRRQRPPRMPAPNGRSRASHQRCRAFRRGSPAACAGRTMSARSRGRSFAPPPRSGSHHWRRSRARPPPQQSRVGHACTREPGERSSRTHARRHRLRHHVVIQVCRARRLVREDVVGDGWCCALTLDAGLRLILCCRDIFPTSWSVCPECSQSMWWNSTLFARPLGSASFRVGSYGGIDREAEVVQWLGASGVQMLLRSFVSRRPVVHKIWKFGRRRRLKALLGLWVITPLTGMMNFPLTCKISVSWFVAAGAAALGWCWATATPTFCRAARPLLRPARPHVALPQRMAPR